MTNDEPATLRSAGAGYAVRRLTAATDAEIRGLAEVLIDCVDGGASVSFMSPLPLEKAVGVLARRRGAARRMAARASRRGGRAGIVGTVQLILDLPENQPHRADLSKMLVHRRARRRGVGEARYCAPRRSSRASSARRLLVLDTASADAERLYARPDGSGSASFRASRSWPAGGLCDTTFFYRTLEPRRLISRLRNDPRAETPPLARNDRARIHQRAVAGPHREMLRRARHLRLVDQHRAIVRPVERSHQPAEAHGKISRR